MLEAGFMTGRVLNKTVIDDEEDNELRLAFDFDGVIANDEAEIVYQDSHDLGKYHAHGSNSCSRAIERRTNW